MKKQLLAILTALSLSFGAFPVYAQEIKDSNTLVYTYSMPFDTKLKTVDNQLYISARDAATILGAGITWNDATKTAVIYETNHTLVFTVDESGYYNNSIQMYSLNKPVVIDEKCYISFIDLLNGAGRRYDYSADGSINVLSPLNTDEGNRTILTSDEYAQKYLNNKQTNSYYTPSQPNYYKPPYSYESNNSYIQSQDYKEYYDKYKEAADKSLESAEKARAEAAELERQLNESLYEQACRDAYVKYQKELLNASTHGTYSSTYADAAKQQYEAELAKYKEKYGM